MKRFLSLAGLALAILVLSGSSWAGDPGGCCYSDGSCRDINELWCGNQGGEWQGAGDVCAVISCEQPEEEEKCSPRVHRGPGWWRSHPQLWYGILCAEGGECEQLMADLNTRGGREAALVRAAAAHMLMGRWEESNDLPACKRGHGNGHQN